jgi:tRNA threonylcarbamoyladenosine biosynthesis protein TsaE
VTEFASHSPEETRTLGTRLGARLGPGAVVACVGELGAGKTCFLQGVGRGLGVESGVSSPTFVLVNQYRGRLPVYHVDAYRTGNVKELIDIGIEEMLHGDGVTVIEWADKLSSLLPPGTITVTITGLGDEPRRIVIEGPSELITLDTRGSGSSR